MAQLIERGTIFVYSSEPDEGVIMVKPENDAKRDEVFAVFGVRVLTVHRYLGST